METTHAAYMNAAYFIHSSCAQRLHFVPAGYCTQGQTSQTERQLQPAQHRHHLRPRTMRWHQGEGFTGNRERSARTAVGRGDSWFLMPAFDP